MASRLVGKFVVSVDSTSQPYETLSVAEYEARELTKKWGSASGRKRRVLILQVVEEFEGEGDPPKWKKFAREVVGG